VTFRGRRVNMRAHEHHFARTKSRVQARRKTSAIKKRSGSARSSSRPAR
jgi:hypothetical protein